MQFACSPVSSALCERMVTVCAEEAEPWLALLDMSMLNEKLLDRLVLRHSVQVHWVLKGRAFDSFGQHGPVLLSAMPDNSDFLRQLVSMCQLKPAFSLLSPRSDMASLVTVLQWLAWVETDDDDVPLYCRFADTRVTSSLLAVLKPHQREQLASVINWWGWPDRLGQGWTCEKFDRNNGQISTPDRLLEFDAQQFSQMLTMAEPDMVYQMLLEKMPDILPQQEGGLIHQRLVSMLAAAHAHGLDDLPDLFQFVVLGLSTYDDFHASPVLAQGWREHRKPNQRFTEWVNEWPDELWAAIESESQAAFYGEANT